MTHGHKNRLQAIGMVTIGALLGYVASSSSDHLADGAAADDRPAVAPVETQPASPALALAARNEAVAAKAEEAGKKPNILVIFGDDIGQTNVSA